MRCGNFQIWFTIFFVSLVRSRLRQNSTPPYPAMKLSFLKNFIFESCCHHTILNLAKTISNMRDPNMGISVVQFLILFLPLWVTVVLLCPGYVVLKFDHTHEKQGTPFVTAMAIFIVLHQSPWNYRPDLMVHSPLPQIICSKTKSKLLKESPLFFHKMAVQVGGGEGGGLGGLRFSWIFSIGKSTFQAP